MKRKAVFFDRDNTLIIGNDYLGDPAKVLLVPGAAEAVARARAMGYATVIVSNQSGVARGMFGEDDVRAVNSRMDEMLRAENPEAIIERHEFCPFHPQAPVERYRVDSDSRKPRPGMLMNAAKEMELDLSRSWLIGDAARDVEAGRAAGCRTILFNDQSLPASPAAQTAPRVPPDFVASTLKEAMDHIAANDGPATLDEPESPTLNSPAAAEHSDPTIPLNGLPEGPPDTAPAEASISTDLARIPGAEPQVETSSPPPIASNASRLESLVEQMLQEMRRSREQPHVDFSVSKLLAGIVQVIAVAVAFLAYLNRDGGSGELWLLAAIFLQAMTASLLIMSRQK